MTQPGVRARAPAQMSVLSSESMEKAVPACHDDRVADHQGWRLSLCAERLSPALSAAQLAMATLPAAPCRQAGSASGENYFSCACGRERHDPGGAQTLFLGFAHDRDPPLSTRRSEDTLPKRDERAMDRRRQGRRGNLPSCRVEKENAVSLDRHVPVGSLPPGSERRCWRSRGSQSQRNAGYR